MKEQMQILMELTSLTEELTQRKDVGIEQTSL